MKPWEEWELVLSGKRPIVCPLCGSETRGSFQHRVCRGGHTHDLLILSACGHELDLLEWGWNGEGVSRKEVLVGYVYDDNEVREYERPDAETLARLMAVVDESYEGDKAEFVGGIVRVAFRLEDGLSVYFSDGEKVVNTFVPNGVFGR